MVSVVIPVYNEERFIGACLASVLEQDYPADRFEVIVADGGSTDSTRDIVRSIATRHANVRLIDNPRRTQAAGLNRAILASRGEFIARQDGHAEWTREHLRRSVRLLVETGVDNVGGRADGVGQGATGRAIACAMRSPFGVGGARFRYSDQLEEVPTVFPGTFRRSAFERVGLFDEAYPPHEDYELNHRIRASGGRVLFSPDIPTRYHVRDSMPALARQYFRYGRAKVRVARSSPGVLRPYHLVAPTMVAAVPAAVLAATPIAQLPWRQTGSSWVLQCRMPLRPWRPACGRARASLMGSDSGCPERSSCSTSRGVLAFGPESPRRHEGFRRVGAHRRRCRRTSHGRTRTQPESCAAHRWACRMAGRATIRPCQPTLCATFTTPSPEAGTRSWRARGRPLRLRWRCVG